MFVFHEEVRDKDNTRKSPRKSTDVVARLSTDVLIRLPMDVVTPTVVVTRFSTDAVTRYRKDRSKAQGQIVPGRWGEGAVGC